MPMEWQAADIASVQAALRAPLVEQEQKSAGGVGVRSTSGNNASPVWKAPQDAGEPTEMTYTVQLSRNERGLGMVFDSNFCVTRLLPGCAAKEQGEIAVGDKLLSVDGIQLKQGDTVSSHFPFGDHSFELTFLRKGAAGQGKWFHMSGKDFLRHRHERIFKEPCGKYFAHRPGPVFEEVLWNDYCVLLPDGTSRPFNEDVRIGRLVGYLRKRKVLQDGRVDFALMNGEPNRGWARHFFELTPKKITWFDEDPNKDVSKLNSLKMSLLPSGKVEYKRPIALHPRPVHRTVPRRMIPHGSSPYCTHRTTL